MVLLIVSSFKPNVNELIFSKIGVIIFLYPQSSDSSNTTEEIKSIFHTSLVFYAFITNCKEKIFVIQKLPGLYF